MKKRLNKKGFTLIELIVVIAILAILAAILIPSLTNYIKKANYAKNSANARSTYTEAQLKMAVGDLADTATSYTGEGGVTCSMEASNKTITVFDCTIDTVHYTLEGNFASPTN
ncbi:MAG TPA: hypothetical protein DCQ90_05835 [Erysipelotrichaceae bacterium]|nr:hypothetical protein [Erysipelotrichaceae bacterium]